MIYRIGHPAYTGANSAKDCTNFNDARMVLLMRGIDGERADRMLLAAIKGSHVTGTTSKGDVIEIVCKQEYLED